MIKKTEYLNFVIQTLFEISNHLFLIDTDPAAAAKSESLNVENKKRMYFHSTRTSSGDEYSSSKYM